MRLLQSVLSCLKQTKKPQHKFVTHLLGLMLMLMCQHFSGHRLSLVFSACS